MPDKGHELRCFCSRKPLLATYGVDSRGRRYVHVRIYKQQRIFGEIIARGDVQLRCRECLRWHTVVIRDNNRVGLQEDTEPPDITEPDHDTSMLAPRAPRP